MSTKDLSRLYRNLQEQAANADADLATLCGKYAIPLTDVRFPPIQLEGSISTLPAASIHKRRFDALPVDVRAAILRVHSAYESFVDVQFKLIERLNRTGQDVAAIAKQLEMDEEDVSGILESIEAENRRASESP